MINKLEENQKTVIILLVALALFLLSRLNFESILLIAVQIIVNLVVFTFIAQQLVDYAEKSQVQDKFKKTITRFKRKKGLI